MSNDGSSPHTRGTHPPQNLPCGCRRFIPAYAGNAVALPVLKVNAAVHPRIRGERTSMTILSRENVGSSPHTRGTL